MTINKKYKQLLATAICTHKNLDMLKAHLVKSDFILAYIYKKVKYLVLTKNNFSIGG